MNEREYRIRRLSDRSGWIVIVCRGAFMEDINALSRIFSTQKEARIAINIIHHAKPSHGKKPIIIVE